ncbi:hypothetical protein BDV18DRAFT_99929 [Aspergillus unguis]
MARVDAADGESASYLAPLSQGPVEARSLSSITSIASNPPNYPRNPAQKKLEPLVLYIVRVPGSKDVFLTPLKPPTRSSVSAEAINASLYYLHVASPDDDILLQEYEQEREERARLRKEGLLDDPDLPLPPPEIARLNNVRRKPVGPLKDGAGPGLDTRPPSLRRRPLPSNSPVLQNENKSPTMTTTTATAEEQTPSPVLPPRSNTLYAPNPAEATTSLTGGEEVRPPMPPRPLPGVPQDEAPFDGNAPPRVNNRWSALPGYLSNQLQRGRKASGDSRSIRHSLDVPRPQLRPTSSHDPSYHSPLTPAHPTGSPGQSPTRRRTDVPPPPHQPGFHITLIRRDPTHGSQWNVATMSTPHLNHDSIDIDVSTPGYSRFAGKNEPLSLDALGLNLPPEARAKLAQHTNFFPQPDPALVQQAQPASHDPTQPRRFHRKLLVSRPHHSDESRGSLDLSNGRPSMDSISGSPMNTSQPTSSKLKSGYYTFTSPWNGSCTFSASVNGRSLKCKHMIPSPGFPNPTQSTPENPAVTVAEIRFNTPFQSGHLHYPGSSHASPFLLSQTTILQDPSTMHDPSIPYYYDPSAPSPSKRAALANLINQKLNRRPSNSSSSDGGNDPPPPPLPRRPGDNLDRLDLSLAREKAGGGIRGDSAKLGKLVIEDEGIKMLDLVVASCMAVWWKGYYY